MQEGRLDHGLQGEGAVDQRGGGELAHLANVDGPPEDPSCFMREENAIKDKTQRMDNILTAFEKRYQRDMQ